MKNVAICCGAHPVGRKFTRHVAEFFPEKISFVAMEKPSNYVSHHLMQYGTHEFLYEDEGQLLKQLKEKKPELLVLAWWPHIIHDEILSLGIPVINFHPSYLPYNRGKYPAYWSIVDDTPFGATIHLVDAGVDTGRVLWQVPVQIEPTDTGYDAYGKALDAMNSLWLKHAQDIMTVNLPEPIKQDEVEATSHHSSEFFEYETIEDSETVEKFIKPFLNDLRARTYPNPKSGKRVKMGDKWYRIHLYLVEEDDN